MAVTLLVPTGLTFSDIREGLSEASLAGLNAWLVSEAKLPVQAGDDNPLVLKLNDFDMGGAAFYRTDAMDGLAECGPIVNFNHMPIEYVQLVVGVGGDMLGMPMFFEIDDPESLTPVELPDSTDENGDQVAWQDWGAPYHTLTQFGEKWYRSTCVGISGEPLKASEFLTYLQSPPEGTRLISLAEYKQIQAEYAPV